MLAIALIMAALAGRFVARGWLSATLIGLLAPTLALAIITLATFPNSLFQLPSMVIQTYTLAFKSLGALAFLDQALCVVAAIAAFYSRKKKERTQTT